LCGPERRVEETAARIMKMLFLKEDANNFLISDAT
jgi:hypothetical protein